MSQIQPNNTYDYYCKSVKEAISNLGSGLEAFVTPEILEGKVTYIDRECELTPPTNISIDAQYRIPYNIDDLDIKQILTPNSKRTIIRTQIKSDVQEIGHWAEKEAEFLTHLDKGRVVPKMVQNLANQRNKVVLRALGADSVIRTNETTGVDGAEVMPASQKMSVASADLDFDFLQSVVSKFDAVGVTGRILSVITPAQRDLLMRDPRFSDNDYAKFTEYGRVSKHTLTDTERITFMVLPAIGTAIPRSSLAQGLIMPDDKMFFWIEDALAGGVFAPRMMDAGTTAALKGQWTAYIKEYYNCVRVDDAGVVQVTTT